MSDTVIDIEKLGAFFLGTEVEAGAATSTPILLPSSHLCTHAVCVGMTGSGKTGLCTALLEEAAIDGIPAIVIDPKGDLSNLALSFAGLSAADFLPWVDVDAAKQEGLTPEQKAAALASTWQKGLTDTLQPLSRVQRFKDAADVVIYTPGSNAGVPLCLLKSLHAPDAAVREDSELLREHIRGTAASILALANVETDNATAPEVVLVEKILEHAFAAGTDLDLSALILAVQKPPFTTVGVLDLDTFFPSKERNALALKLNAVLASPGFAAWREGEPLSIKRMLYSDSGKPRIAVLSIAHLDDAGRMFFVTQLLTELLSWVRSQSGTSSLRALLFMDEVFGFLPPVKNPPSKTPLLTLLKQARAFGVGVVLATQNPVDLDYKALANMGTWLLGRLQTERDKARLLDGLEGASGAGFSRDAMDTLLSSLGKRQFVLHSVHEKAARVLQSRFTLSFLRGPMTRAELKRIAPAQVTTATTTVAKPKPAAGPSTMARASTGDVPERFSAKGGLLSASIVAAVKTHHVDAKAGIDVWRTVQLQAHDLSAASVFAEATAVDANDVAGDATPPPSATFVATAPLPTGSAAKFEKSCKDVVFQQHPLTLLACEAFELVAGPDEKKGDFVVRVDQKRREARDAAVASLKQRFEKRVATLETNIEKLRERVEREEAQASSATMDTALSFGSAVLGAVFGRKLLSQKNLGGAARSVSKATRASAQHDDVKRAQEALSAAEASVHEVEAEFQQELAALDARLQQDSALIEKRLPVKKADSRVEQLYVLWS